MSSKSTNQHPSFPVSQISLPVTLTLSVLATLLVGPVAVTPAATPDIPSFEPAGGGGNFHTLVVNDVSGHEQEGDVYVGGTNTIYQLSKDLELRHKYVSGPAECSEDEVGCDSGAMNNDFKVLAVSSRKGMMLACGTMDHGVCTMHSLVNVNKSQGLLGNDVQRYVGSRKTSLLLLGDDKIDKGQEVADVFFEYDGRDIDFTPVTFTQRILKLDASKYDLRYAKKDDTIQAFSGYGIDGSLIGSYYMSFVYAFEYGNFIYVVMNQQSSISIKNQDRIVIKIGRYCSGLKDAEYRTYIETEVTCKRPDSDTNYNGATAAVMADGRLYISAIKYDGRTPSPQHGTTLCMFPMEDIDNHFQENYFRCFTEDRTFGLPNRVDWNTGEMQGCQEDQGMMDFVDNICNAENHVPINLGVSCNGELHTKHREYEGVLMTFEEHITSLAKIKVYKTTATVTQTLLAVGDAEGNIRKVKSHFT